MKKVFLVVAVVVLTVSAMAQNVIKGTVSDEQGQPLVGVNVVVKNSYVGTITDANGVFELTRLKHANQTLIFSFVGYEKKEVTTNEQTDMQVTLEPSTVMTGEVVVSAVRARPGTPIAYSEMDAEAIESANFGQDLPYLLNQMPGVVTNSDAGTGIGYTNFRIRGTDMTRINMTVNGIPLNDSESQGVFWVNMPDFAASVDNMQVQRGVGTSSNGAASFGGSVNLSTLNASPDAMAFIDNSYGSFETWKNSVAVSTGLLKNSLAFDARLSRITSDGFIDRAASDLKSYYLSGGYYGTNTTVKLITFSGTEKTYQAWNGVPKVKLDNDREGMEKLVMMDGWPEEEAANLYASNARTFNRYLYDNQTDNYKQDHYQLHFTHRLNELIDFTVAAHYTKGKGYYESFKYAQKFSKYNVGFDEVIINGESVKKTDLIRRKWLDNDFYGLTFSGNYHVSRLHLTLGGAYNEYDGDHYGNVIWTAYNNGIPANHEWYRNNGKKKDFNSFAKATLELVDGLAVYGDVQYRHIDYVMSGTHDDQSNLGQSYNFDFVNPKFGLNWDFSNEQRLFASFAMAQREPSRSDFRDADAGRKPTAEKLYDWELGYELSKRRVQLNVNAFYMDYTDQLVLTGEINNVGGAMMVNVPESYRAGIEISGGWVILPKLQWSANVALSTNKIKNFTEYVDDWDTWTQHVNELGKTDIAFSPEVTAFSRLDYQPVTGLTLSVMQKYVGDQFIDNTSSEERKLDAYLVDDIMVNYDFKLQNIGDFNVGVKLNNTFDQEYETNAWVYRYYSGGEHDVLDGYFPQAGFNVMIRVGMKF